MRDNYNTLIDGEKVELVPYKRKFVEKYHQWMQDVYLQEMTASEPLTLEGEFEMQQSWREDSKKCTFILLSKPADGATEIDRMVGDVNMFLNDRDDPTVAELEIMIAESSARRQGIGREAVHLMMHFGLTRLNLTRFYVKINEVNAGSIAMFKSLGFVEVNYVPAFGEFELQYLVGKSDVPSHGPVASLTDEEIERNKQQVLERGQHAVYRDYEEPANYDN